MSVLPLSMADAQALAIVAAVLAVGVAERLCPRSDQARDLKVRRVANIGLFTINAVLVAVPLSYLMGYLADLRVFSTAESPMLEAAGPVVVWLWWLLMLDFAGYLLHRAFHSLPMLYRIHCTHHSDREVDLTTAFRRHPIEFFLNAALTCAAGLAIGAPLDVVGVYGIAASVVQIWHHGNLTLPARVDRTVGRVVVTPALHLSHHALDYHAANCNYGTVLSVWDRIFRTLYSGPEPREFGVKSLTGPDHQRLEKVLLSPILFDPHAEER